MESEVRLKNEIEQLKREKAQVRCLYCFCMFLYEMLQHLLGASNLPLVPHFLTNRDGMAEIQMDSIRLLPSFGPSLTETSKEKSRLVRT